jgi:hypothetical protein
MTRIFVKVGGAAYSREQAQAVIAGYAWGVVPLSWRTTQPKIGDAVPGRDRRRWAYDAYDCAPADPGDLRRTDITLSAPINSRIGSKTTLNILAAAADISSALGNIPTSTTFWGLPADHVAKIPPEGSGTQPSSA